MDGCESVRRYREYEKARIEAGSTHKPLLIIGSSAKNDDETVAEVMASGMNGFIPKVKFFTMNVADNTSMQHTFCIFFVFIISISSQSSFHRIDSHSKRKISR